jgi:sucrose phosphorylase
MSPRNAINVLDTHDGIGVIDVGPDKKSSDGLPGLLSSEEINHLVETIHERSNGTSRQATGAAANNLDLYQVNCTYYDALGQRDDEYLIARALQFFAPGVPQVYYVGLLAGANDTDLLRRTGVGRDINRHFCTRVELQERLGAPVVRSLLDLIRFRNAHPAFGGDFQVHSSDNNSIAMEWRKHPDWARLDVDLTARRAAISHSDPAGDQKRMLVTSAIVEVDC